MRATETAAELAGFEGRGAGTDSERRAARWLATQLQGRQGTVRLEPFWCRPNTALAHVWHLALAVAGSLVAVHEPRVGGAMILASLLCLIADERLGISPGRRLTPEHASQNVVATPKAADAPTRVHLVITANYDAGRAGLVYRDAIRRPVSAVAKLTGRRAPGWVGWLAILLVWLLVTAIFRLDGAHGTPIGIAQLIPTAALVLALALLIELGSSGYGPAAGDDGSGVAVALALAAALDAAPPRRLSAEIVLQGASDASGVGLRHHLRTRRQELGAANTVVLGIDACGGGEARYWISDGQLVPQRYFRELTRLCADLKARPHRGRGAGPAFRARAARLPAITIGARDEAGLAPRSHQSSDLADELQAGALDATLALGLMLVDSVDAFLRDRPASSGRRDRIALGRPLAVLSGGKREAPDQL